jgi:hypothetical protein
MAKGYGFLTITPFFTARPFGSFVLAFASACDMRFEYYHGRFHIRRRRLYSFGKFGGDCMNPKESGRRRFLKTAGGAAIAMVTADEARGQSAQRKNTAAGAHTQGDSAGGGLWVTWYDLPEKGRDAYLSWLHGKYLPELLKRPGYTWAAHYATTGGPENSPNRLQHTNDPSVPTGFRYILLVGAKDAAVFGNPVPTAINAALPEDSRKMLAMRIEERVNLMAVTGIREGRARNEYEEGSRSAPCIQIGSFNCPVEYQEELQAWYVQVRLPAMCATASCIRIRMLNSVAGWAKHAILYEFTSPKWFDRDYGSVVKNSPQGVGGDNIIVKLVHAPHGPNSAVRIWPPVPKT